MTDLSPIPNLSFLAAGGEMGALMRALDWSATPLGAPRTWPQSLRTTVGLLLATNHPMFIWWGPELIQFYNDAYRRTMGPERHPSALGQPGRECWAEIWDIIGPQIEQVMAGKGATWHEDQLVPVTRHGRLEEVWWTYSYSPINDEHGGVGGVLVVCNDVTKQHLMTEALQEADRRKDEFLAMLGHELRNPLAPIISSVAVLDRAGSHDSPHAAHAREIIARQANHLRELVDELLDVARINTGKITLKKDAVAITSAVDRAVEQSRDLMESNRHRFDVSVPQTPLYVEGDLSRLTQVISNLLNNAAKYTEPGGTVTLTTSVHGTQVCIEVTDTGMGISADVLPYVFDLFTQSGRALDRSHGGLGVGLTLVRRLVELHGGRVEAHSPGPAKGSRFRVWLPLMQTAAPEHRALAAEGQASAVKARRILVVDDNADAADMLSMVLSLAGHSVCTVNHGLEVLDRAREFRPDIILLDLGLPGLSGFEIARQLRASSDLEHVTLIALTGYGQDEDRRQSRAHGFDHHVVKPVDLDALSELINNA